MENEPTTSGQNCEKCGGKEHGMCCGKKWHGKHRGGGHAGCGGGMWAIGWLFTIGFLQLSFWKGVLAIAIWPYYLGAFFR